MSGPGELRSLGEPQLDRAGAALRVVVLLAVALLAVTSAGRPASAADAGDGSDLGRDVFEANCASCHGGDASGRMGPSLRGAVERLTREGVEVTIRNGRRSSPAMPAFEGRLSDQEMAAVIDFLDTLPPEDGRGGDGMMDGMQGPMGSWMWLIPFLAALAIVGLVLAVIRGTRRR